MRPSTELRAAMLALLKEQDGEALSGSQLSSRLGCGISSAKHTAESLVTSGVARQRKTGEGHPGYHIPSAAQLAEESARHGLRCLFRPLKPRQAYNEAVARALAERNAVPSIG